MAQNATISAKQKKTIASLLETGNITRTCEEVGVNRSTVYRWRKDSAFIDALREAQADALAVISISLASLLEKAIDALADGLDADQKLGVRLKAADSVLSKVLTLHEQAELEQRIQRLEQKINESN